MKYYNGIACQAKYPISRPRRLRRTGRIRDLVSETTLSPSNLVLPVFVDERISAPKQSESLAGVTVYPPRSHELIDLFNEALELRIGGFLIFGIPRNKDEEATRAWATGGPVQEAIRFIRKELGSEPLIATDLCICGYASHGHCGQPKQWKNSWFIDNDSTLNIYKKIAVSQAEAGSDLIAPSGMMDGQVSAIREALDANGYIDVGIMSYSAKYASYFYGPFRGVMDSAPRFGDRRSYQMDPRNAMEALREVCLDISEGADIVMVKPALSYLDIIRLVKEYFPHIPLAAYNVSGEYMLVELASRYGLADKRGLMLEILYSIRRAGADIIISYHSLEAARFLNNLI